VKYGINEAEHKQGGKLFDWLLGNYTIGWL